MGLLSNQNLVFTERFLFSIILFPSDSGLGRNSRSNVTPKLKVRILAVLPLVLLGEGISVIIPEK